MFSGWKYWLWKQEDTSTNPKHTITNWEWLALCGKGAEMDESCDLTTSQCTWHSRLQLENFHLTRKVEVEKDTWHFLISACMFVSTYICKFMRRQYTHTCAHTHTHKTHTNTQGHLHMHTQARIQDTHTHTHFHTTHRNSYKNSHTFTIWTLTHIHTCTHIHTDTPTQSHNTLTHTSHIHKENRSGIFLEQAERRMRSYSWASNVSGVDSSVDR